VLELYNGQSRRIDRKGRGAVIVPNWSASILCGVQPDRIRAIAPKLSDDGLIQRFVPVFGRGWLEGIDRAPDQEAIDGYEEFLKRLVNTVPRDPKSATPSECRRVVFTFSARAQEERRKFSTLVQALLRLPMTSRAFKGFLSKSEGLFARLALVFHFAEHVASQTPDIISHATAERVRRFLARFVLPNAGRFYEEIVVKNHDAHARWIAGHILAHKLTTITDRTLYRAYHSLRDDGDGRFEAMTALATLGWVTPVDQGNGKMPKTWIVNPRVHELYGKRAEMEKAQREKSRQEAVEAMRLVKRSGLARGGAADE
jgi:hypothetical protein